MSILGLGLGLLFPAAGIGGLMFKFGARAVLGKAQSVATGIPWAKVLPALVVLVAILSTFLAFHYAAEARHERKATVAAMADVAKWKKQDQADVAAHLVTKASLTEALAKIDDTNRRIAAAGADLERSKQEAAANEARLAGQFKATKATADALRDDAARKDRVPCKVSVAAAKALEGL